MNTPLDPFEEKGKEPCPRTKAGQIHRGELGPWTAEVIAGLQSKVRQQGEVIESLHQSIARASALKPGMPNLADMEALRRTIEIREDRISELSLHQSINAEKIDNIRIEFDETLIQLQYELREKPEGKT